jgi:seryl-tRNA synthetase
MVDIAFIRTNSDRVKQAVRDKRVDVDIDELLRVDARRRELQQQLDGLQQERKQVAGVKDIERGRQIKQEIQTIEKEHQHVVVAYTELLWQVPQIPSEDTPVGADESGNVVVRQVGVRPTFDFEPRDHEDLGRELGVIDLDTASDVAGARFAYLKGDLVHLQFALVQFAMSVLTSREQIEQIALGAGIEVDSRPFVPVIPPYVVRPEVMEKMARLKPEDDRYHTAADDLYLIGSAEHTLGPMHMKHMFAETDLPVRYVGYSPAFRREAGTYGKDTKGILRLHQFDKLEMESFTLPEHSDGEQQLFVAIQEYLVSQLGLAYQVVLKCTGDMGTPDYRAIDIEVWIPSQKTYRETHTSDHMADYQSRRLQTAVKRSSGTREFVHMNDATAFAMGRTLLAIMEHYQQADGRIRIPDVLQPFMFGKAMIEKTVI